jgi:hypothetical protein
MLDPFTSGRRLVETFHKAEADRPLVRIAHDEDKGAEQQPGTANEDGGNGRGAEPQSIYDQEQRYHHKHDARTMMHKPRILRTIQMW